MKRIFLGLLAVLSLASCQPEPSATGRDIQITGTVGNASAKKAIIISVFGQQDVAITDDQFQKTIKSEQPTMLSVMVGNTNINLFVQPGDSIHLDYGTALDQMPDLQGGAVAENQFLTSLTDSLQMKVGSPWSIYRQPEEAALAKVTEINKYGNLLLTDYLAENPKTAKPFRKLAGQYIQYFTGQFLAEYPTYYQYANPEEENYQPGEELKSAIAELQKEQPEMLHLPLYIDVLSAKKTAKANQLMEEDSSLQSLEGYLTATQMALESEFSNPEVIEMMTYHHIREYIQFDGTNGVEDTYETFLAEAENDALKSEIKTQYEAWAHLAKGQPAPDFTYPDIESQLHALSDFKGKVVYIDVWATWCGPCLAEQPYLAEIEAAYEGNENIVFMGVSIDADKSAWENMVSQKEMSGVQLFADGAWESKITRNYLISGIPRFILIDADGKIVDPTAYRPSNEKLKVQLETLVKGKPLQG